MPCTVQRLTFISAIMKLVRNVREAVVPPVQAEKLVLPVMVQVRCAEVPDFLPFSRLVLPVTEAVLQ